MELRQPRKPSRGAIASPRRGGALTMLDEATRTELLDRLRAQEEAQLPYGAWVYQVWNAGASEVPATFDSARFTAGLDALTATPSYRELVNDAPEKWDPAQQVVLEQDENTVTLLGPEQFYAFDGAGRVCHEFVRYIAQPNGTILAQEIVKRVFDPADGGRELVICEIIGGTDASERVPERDGSVPSTENSITSELRTSGASLDVGTVEGQWTPWAFGLSFDRAGGTDASGAGALRAAPQHEASATLQTRVRRHCQPPAGGSVPSAPWISVGLESYDILWQVGDAQSGRLVLQGEKDGETARLVLDEMGTTMTKELTDSRTGLRFHQGSTLAASEMQWFPANATEGDTVVHVDEWFGFEADGSVSKAKNTRKIEIAGSFGIPKAAVRTCVIQTTKTTTGDMQGYCADLFDMALGLNDAVYALPTTDDTTMTVSLEGTSEDDSLTTEESQSLTSLASDLIQGLIPFAAGGCDPTYKTLTISIEGLGLTAPVEGSHQYLLNDEVEILATASDPYFSFDHWEGAASGSSNPVTVTMDDDKSVTAVFDLGANVSVDLTGWGLDGEVSEANEDVTGIFIHNNIDNDNANTSGGLPVQDRVDTTDPVTGENDLALMTMEMSPVPTCGEVSLIVAGNGIKVWKSGTKGSANFFMGAGTLTWSLADSGERTQFTDLCSGSLYVEGVTNNASTVTVNFRYGADTVEDELHYKLISANCGAQPTPAQRTRLGGWFPNLVHCEWSITDPPSEIYNCLAFSVNCETKNYDGGDIDKCGNNDGILDIPDDVNAFYWSKANLTPIPANRENPQNDAKVIFFYNNDGSGVHAAKKKEDGCNCGQGKWLMFESKCGNSEKIEHVWDQLNGSSYGSNRLYYE